MCSVEKVLSHKYDWHVSSNMQIGGNQGEQVEGTRAMAPSVRSPNCTRTYNFHPPFWLSYPSPWHYIHLPGITFISPVIRPARLKKSFYVMYNHARSNNKRNTAVVGVSHNYLFSVSSSEQSQEILNTYTITILFALWHTHLFKCLWTLAWRPSTR